jgi:hydrogenase expression/formation protein HypC
VCIAVPGRIVTIVDGPGLPAAVVDVAGVTRECCLAYVPEAAVGDYVTVHGGFAIGLLDEQAALESLALFQQLGVLAEKPASGSNLLDTVGEPDLLS